MYIIRMGLPEMESLWQDLSLRSKLNMLKKDEAAFFKTWVKSLDQLPPL